MPALEANLAKADKYLAPFRESGVLNQIGGEALPASDGTTF
jgi:5-carboxymethyl-2-hydroxymuconic-semialdehyde dehydrogenase